MAIKDEIIKWVFSETTQNIFWLYGVAGSGKSTVSTTVASHFRDMSRLGAFLFFERGKSEPSSVIRTIAYNVALYDSSIAARIISEITSNHDIIGAPSMDQFNRLLLHPLSSASLSAPGPVVIVLDALDECGTPETRRGLIALLQNEFSNLPNTFRFLVTSRQEADIDWALSSRSEFVCATALDYTSPVSQRDVLSFLHAEFDAMRHEMTIRSEWPRAGDIDLLGRASGGLFIWASTAVKMVKDSDRKFRELEALVSGARSSQSGIGLDELYATVLRSSGIKWERNESRDWFVKVLSILLASRIPLTIAALDGILGLPAEDSAALLLSRLRSVITYSEGGSISLLHTSFSDYLFSPKQSGEPWLIDLDNARRLIAEQCFVVMKSELRFNICSLESSYVRNDDVQDLADRIKSRISPQLKYACLHWAQHLSEISCSSELLRMVSEFAYIRLLFWFEVLSLIKMFGRVVPQALSDASRWCEVSNLLAFTLGPRSRLLCSCMILGSHRSLRIPVSSHTSSHLLSWIVRRIFTFR